MNLSLDSISSWPGRCEFQVHDMFMEDINDHCIIRYFGSSTTVAIESRIEIVSEWCFANCTSLTSVTFDPNSKLRRIDESALAESDLRTIDITASVESI
jgi:hypothetical protein